ncbi:hypothetical protein BsWGS_21516 [Bradybaena similaris]
MSEKTAVNKEHQLTKNASSRSSQGRQYSREDLRNLSKQPESVKRPKCLEHDYDCENGKWDPERWYTANFEPAPESSSFTFANGKDNRKVTDRDYKKRYSPNNPVERVKDERDGIVLGPQRRSFVTGCHVKTPPHSYTRHLSLPDREDSKGDWDQKGDKEKDSRERPVRKVDSGRIHFEKEKNHHETIDSHVYSRDVVYDHEFSKSRDKGTEREQRKRERDLRESAREKRGDRNDSFRSADDKGYTVKDWRDRDFRDRGFDRNSRRRHHREEKEPEWYTGGPTSQTDVIELRGFDHEEDHGNIVMDGRKPHPRKDSKTSFSGQSAERSQRGQPEVSSPINKISKSSLEETRTLHNEQKEQKNIPNQKQQEQEQHNPMTQQNSRSATNKLFDFEQVMSAILPLDENGIRHASRFSRFFPEPNGSMLESDASSLEDVRVSCDGNHSRSIVPSPTPTVGPMGAMQPAYLCMPQFHGQPEQHIQPQTFPKPQHSGLVPDSAGDNNGHSPMLPSLTALFNSAARGGHNACRWNGHLDGSLETPETSLFSNSATSNVSFSTQDAEAQLKAMLFGGNRESASSGAVSPCLPLGVHQKAKTLAELEAHMHQDWPPRTSSLTSLPDGASSMADGGDVTAFNKLLIMINAASEANQNMAQSGWSSHAGSGMVPSHNEFNLAVMRNKEKQIQLLQQSLHNTQQPVAGMCSPPQQAFQPHMAHSGQSLLPQTHQQAQAMLVQQYQRQQLDGVTTPGPFADATGKQPHSVGMPQAMSTPQPGYKFRAPAGGGSAPSVEPILSLIQQNPRIIMNTGLPTGRVPPMMPSQQSLGSGPTHASSPLMFGQMSPTLVNTMSPVQPCRSSPAGAFTFGASLPRSAMSSPTEMRLPGVSRVLSPFELSARNQAVAHSALFKRQLQEQSDHYLMQEQDRASSPGQHHIVVVRPVPAAQPVIPPTPQPKWFKFQGASLDTFTPTSVLRKMHSDKVVEKSKPQEEIKNEDFVESRPFLHGTSESGPAGLTEVLPPGDVPQKSDPKEADLPDINFLDPVNPNLTAVSGQLDSQVRPAQRDVLPGPLSQPMSVEEKMKLSALAEKPGYLSQMLDKSAKVTAETGGGASLGRPAIEAEELSQEDTTTHQQHAASTQHHEQTPQSADSQSCRAVTGAGAEVQSLSDSATQPSAQQNPAHRQVAGRAIVGRSSVQQQLQTGTAPPAQNVDVLHVLGQQNHFQQMLSMQAQCQGMVLQPPPVRRLVPCLDPATMAHPVSYPIPLPGQPVDVGCGLMQPQSFAAGLINPQHNQHMSHMMSMQYSPQHCLSQPPPPVMSSSVSAQLNPYSQTSGPLSTAALQAAIQRLASPPGAVKMNRPHQPPAATHAGGGGSGGGNRVDMTTGIQRWFSSDILRTQLPSLPPLPSLGVQVMTVDELERS